MNQQTWGLHHFFIPRIIGVIWWLTVFGLVLATVFQFIIPWYLGRSMDGVGLYEILKSMWISVALLVVVRVFLECLSVVFSIHDRLEEILDVLKKDKGQTRILNLETSKASIPPRTKPQLFS